MDLDGNGLAEAAYFGPNGFVRAQHSPTAPPPRLLYRVHNGRGAHTTVEYASMHDQTAVEQHPEQTWSDGRPKASPHTQWVVKSLLVDDDLAATTSTTSYVYKNPRHGPVDDDRRFAFRGFEDVTTTAPSGAKTIHRYDYATDPSGRRDKTVVVPFEAPNAVRSIDKTTWQAFTLFDGAIKTYHATTVERFTCANGQTEATCTVTAAPGYTRTTSTLDCAHEHDPEWHPSPAVAGDGVAPANRSRRRRRRSPDPEHVRAARRRHHVSTPPADLDAPAPRRRHDDDVREDRQDLGPDLPRAR